MIRSKHLCFAIATGAVALATSVHAATLAQFDFEEGTPGNKVFDDPAAPTNAALDISGNGNNFRAFDAAGSPSYSAIVPSATTPKTGAPNRVSLLNPNDLFINNPTSSLQSYNFTNGFTIEASVRPADLDQYGGIFGKDGKPIASSQLAPLQLKLRNDTDKFQIEVVDAAGVGHDVQSTIPTLANTYYDLAATYDGTTLSLYAKPSSDTGPYVLQGSTLTPSIADGGTAGLTIGRGFFNGATGDFFRGNIDNVRISDTALSPSQFLGVAGTVPEPASLGLIGLGGLALLRRRKH